MSPAYNPAATKAMWACVSPAANGKTDYDGIIAALDNGADPNHLNDQKTSILHLIVGERLEPELLRLAAIRKLAEKGADLNQRCYQVPDAYLDNIRGESPLFNAAYAGHSKIIDLLLKLGADSNHRSDINHTALFRTINASSAIRLIEAGIDLSVRDKKLGHTAFEAWSGFEHKSLLDTFSALPPDMRKVNLYHRIYPHLSKDWQKEWTFDPSPIMRQAAASAARDSAVARYLANSTTQKARRP